MTQCERVIDHIRRFGSITTAEAFYDLGIARLASRIWDLKQEGYEFEEETVRDKNRFGETVHFKRYTLKEDK